MRGGEETAGVDALDLVLRGPGDKMAVIDCDGMSEILWVYAKRRNTRTNPLLARLEHTRGDRAQTLHPHHALAVDVVHEEAFAGNWTENSARSFHIRIDIDIRGGGRLTQRLPEPLALRRARDTHGAREERVAPNAPLLRTIESDGHDVAPRLRREQHLARPREDRLRHLRNAYRQPRPLPPSTPPSSCELACEHERTSPPVNIFLKLTLSLPLIWTDAPRSVALHLTAMEVSVR